MDKKYGRHIIGLGHTIKRYIDNSLSLHGLTGQQARVLRVIYENSLSGDVYQKEIERYFNVRRSTVTQILQVLENLNYIERRSSSKDARSKVIKITEKGIEASQYGKEIIENVEETIAETLTSEELEFYINMTEKLKSKFLERENSYD